MFFEWDVPVWKNDLSTTYNFPENRIADHRTGYKAYNLDVVLAGDLDAVVQSCIDTDLASRLAGEE